MSKAPGRRLMGPWTMLLTALLLSALISPDAHSQLPVLFDLHTDKPGDKLWVGESGSLVFSVNANGRQVQGIQYTFLLEFTPSNWIGRIPESSFVPSPTAMTTFASIAWNPSFSQGVNPDTLLFGFTSFGGPWIWNEELFRLNVIPSAPGTLHVNSQGPFMGPPTMGTYLASPIGDDIPYEWVDEDKVIEAIQPPVVFDVRTDKPGDKLWVGEPGTITFTVDANGNTIQGLIFALTLNFSGGGGNWIGPLSILDNVEWLLPCNPGFGDCPGWDWNYGNGSNPDTLLLGGTGFGGPWSDSGSAFTIHVTPAFTGTLSFDTVPLPPANLTAALNPLGATLPLEWVAGSKLIEATLPPVQFTTSTNNGNDSLYVGIPGSILFNVDAQGNLIQGMVFPFELVFTGGNWIGPIADAFSAPPLNVVPSPMAQATFASIAWNPNYGNGTNPDSMLYGFTSFGGPWTLSDEVFRIKVTPSGPGTVYFRAIPLPPAGALDFLDPNGASTPYVAHMPTITSAVVPIVEPVCDGATVEMCPESPGPYYAGSGIVAHAMATVPPESLLTFRFAGLKQSGSYNEPDNPVQVRAFGGIPVDLASDLVMLWYPGPGETGPWEICFETVTTEHDTLICCIPIEVESPLPDHVQWQSGILEFVEPNVFPATLELHFTTSPDSTQALVLPLLLQTVSGTAYLAQRPDSLDFVYPPEFGIFDFKAVNNFAMNAFGSPDSLLLGFIDLFAQYPGIPPATHIVQMHAEILPEEGIFQFDTTFLPPGNFLEFITVVGPGFREIIPSYGGGCFPVLKGNTEALCFSFGCVEDVLTGSDVCVPLEIHNLNPCQELGGFDLLFTYDASLLTFQGLDLTGSMLEAAGWEYMTYRIVSTNPAKVRIVAIADMNNSNQHPNDLCLDGLVALACFQVSADQNAGCQSAHIQFWWDDCGDNTASDPSGDILYVVTDPNGAIPYTGGDPDAVPPIPGGGIITNSCNIDAQLATFQGGGSGPDGFPCLNPDTTKPDPVRALCFINGKIKIICPGDIDDRGDLNFNALAYEIADAVLYSNYFIQGPSVFTISIPGQTAASDVNADGTPLTVADLVYLIRVITGDAQPIPGDILGGGPKLAKAGTIQVISRQQGSNVSVSTSSDADLGAGLFVFNYRGTGISRVQVVGRASDMELKFQASDGELRVLVYDIEGGHRVAAGQGEMLSVVTTGGGSVELVSLEAATFMGGRLEATREARVLPTQFALKQNFPNPFNSGTEIRADFPVSSDYSIVIYNMLGETVKTFSGTAEPGTLSVTWDGRTATGSEVASGVYFYRIAAGVYNDVRRMLLIK